MKPQVAIGLKEGANVRETLERWLTAYDSVLRDYENKAELCEMLKERAKKAAELIEAGVENAPELDGDFPLGNEADMAFAADVFTIMELVKIQCGLHHMIREQHYVEPAYDILVRNGFLAELYGEWNVAAKCYNGVPLSKSVDERQRYCKKKMHEIGLDLYEKGHKEIDEGKIKDGYLLISQAAEMRHEPAMIEWALARMDGRDGYPIAQTEGRDLLFNAAWHGSANAAFAICKLHDEGYEIIDAHDAFSMCKRAAEAGHKEAQARLEEGFDLRPIEEIYEQRVADGDIEALWKLYKFYDKKNDIDTAAIWLGRAIEAGQHDALVCAAEYYLAEGEEDYNPELAEQYLRRAATEGCVQAILLLGNMEASKLPGNFWEMDGSPDEAVRAAHERQLGWYRLAAEAGDKDAMYYVGLAYNKGYPVKRDNKEAYTWFNRAKEAGNDSALYALGYVLENGFGVKKDVEEAVRLYTQAAEKGTYAAMVRLYEIYKDGLDSIAPDKDKAFRYLWLSGVGRD